jgi:hypothetical protein
MHDNFRFKYAITLNAEALKSAEIGGLDTYFAALNKEDDFKKFNDVLKEIHKVIKKDSNVNVDKLRHCVSLMGADDQQKQQLIKHCSSLIGELAAKPLVNLLMEAKDSSVEELRKQLRLVFVDPKRLNFIIEHIDKIKTGSYTTSKSYDSERFYNEFLVPEWTDSILNSFPIVNELYEKSNDKSNSPYYEVYSNNPVKKSSLSTHIEIIDTKAPESEVPGELVVVPFNSEKHIIRACFNIELGKDLETEENIEAYFKKFGGSSKGSGYPLKPYQTFPFYLKIVVEQTIRFEYDENNHKTIFKDDPKWVLLIPSLKEQEKNNKSSKKDSTKTEKTKPNLSEKLLRALCSSNLKSTMSNVIVLSEEQALNEGNGINYTKNGIGDDGVITKVLNEKTTEFKPNFVGSPLNLTVNNINRFQDSHKSITLSTVFIGLLCLLCVGYLVALAQGINVWSVFSGVNSWYDFRLLGGASMGMLTLTSGIYNAYKGHYQHSGYTVKFYTIIFPVIIGLGMIGFSYSLLGAASWWNQPASAFTGTFDPRAALGAVGLLLSVMGLYFSIQSKKCFVAIFSCFRRHVSFDGISKKAKDFLVKRFKEITKDILDVMLFEGWSPASVKKVEVRDKRLVKFDKDKAKCCDVENKDANASLTI